MARRWPPAQTCRGRARIAKTRPSLEKVAGISLSASTMWVVGFFPIELRSSRLHRSSAALWRSTPGALPESYWASRGDAATAGDRTTTGGGQTGDVPRRRRLRQARDLRGDGGARRGLRDSHPANKSLELEIEDILFRPPGRPNAKPLVRYKSFRYQAESWSKARRVIAKQITRTGRAEAVTKEGLAATLLPARQPDRMGQRHPLRPVRPR